MSILVKNGVIGCKICIKKGVIVQADDIGRYMGVPPPPKKNTDYIKTHVCKLQVCYTIKIIPIFMLSIAECKRDMYSSLSFWTVNKLQSCAPSTEPEHAFCQLRFELVQFQTERPTSSGFRELQVSGVLGV